MAAVLIGLGSNMGDKAAHLSFAIEKISELATIEKVSEFIASEPWGVTEQAPFLNAALRIDTPLSPEQLLLAVLDIENQAGRQRNVHWGARTLDIDLLDYERQIILQPQLRLPHPFLHQRAFVLLPLLQIEPDYIHPVLGLNLNEMLLLNC